MASNCPRISTRRYVCVDGWVGGCVDGCECVLVCVSGCCFIYICMCVLRIVRECVSLMPMLGLRARANMQCHLSVFCSPCFPYSPIRPLCPRLPPRPIDCRRDTPLRRRPFAALWRRRQSGAQSEMSSPSIQPPKHKQKQERNIYMSESWRHFSFFSLRKNQNKFSSRKSSMCFTVFQRIKWRKCCAQTPYFSCQLY